MNDLFGTPIIPPPPRHDHAHPAPAGSGPPKTHCRFCRHCIPHHYNNHTYYKCDLVKPTHGKGTDLRLSDLACLHFGLRPK